MMSENKTHKLSEMYSGRQIYSDVHYKVCFGILLNTISIYKFKKYIDNITIIVYNVSRTMH